MPAIKPIRGILLNRTHPLARGLVGLWLFNEGSGKTVNDLSGNGNTGTFVSAVTWTSGKFGPALDFAGSNDYINCGNRSNLNIAEQITLIVLVRFDSFTAKPVLIEKSDGEGGSFTAYRLLGRDTTVFRIVLELDGVTETIDSNSSLSTGVWYHLVATYDGANVRLYINGVLDKTEAKSGTISTNSQDLYLGDSWDLAKDFNGLYGHVLIYNRALIDSEVVLSYRRPFCVLKRGIRTELFPTAVVPPIVVARPRSHVGFRPIEGADRLRGLRRNALY